MTMYRHTQKAWWMVLLFVGLIAPAFVSYFSLGPKRFPVWALYLVLGFAVLLIALFWKLTVEVTQSDILVSFGIGLIKRKIPLSDIQSCEAVTNKWYWGWGIRFNGVEWIWNISGLQAVQLHYKSGGSFRIGTDEPQKLQQAIETNLPE